MKNYTIGFANLTEKDEGPIQARRSLESAIAKHDHLNLILRDNQLSTEQAQINMQYFADIPVDLAVLFHLDERNLSSVIKPLIWKGIPVITMAVRVTMAYFFGLDDKQAGKLIGEGLKEWVEDNWQGEFDKVLVLTPQTGLTFNMHRIEAALEVFKTMPTFAQNKVLYVDEGGTSEKAVVNAKAVMEQWKDQYRVVILSLIDYIAIPVLDMIRDLGYLSQIVCGSFDSTNAALDEFRKPDSRLVVASTFEGERFGDYMVPMILDILDKKWKQNQPILMPAKLRTRAIFLGENEA